MDQPLLSNYFICVRNSTFQTQKLPWKRNRHFRKPAFVWRWSRDRFFLSSLNCQQSSRITQMSSSPSSLSSVCRVISPSSHELGAGNLGSELCSHPAREPQDQNPNPSSHSQVHCGVSFCTHWPSFPKPQGCQTHSSSTESKELISPAGSDTPSLSCTFLLGHKAGWPHAQSPKKALVAHSLSFGSLFLGTLPYFPNNLSA